MERLFLSPGLVLFFVGIVSVVVNRIFFYSEFQSVHYIYLFGCVAFSLLYGYVRCLHFFSGFKLSTSIEPPLVNKNLIKLYKIISIVGAVIGVAVIVKFGVLGGGGIVYNLRYRHTYEGSGNYGASYCAVFALVVSLLSILQKKIKDSFFYFIAFLIPSISIGERTSILFGVCAILYVSISCGYARFKHLLFAGLFFIALAVLMAFSAGKDQSNGMFFLLPYFSYGISAFDANILANPSISCLGIVFGSFAKVLPLHECVSPISIDDGEFNVFTYLAEPYLWFGMWGVFFAMSFMGLFYGFLKGLESRSSYFVIVNATLIFSVFMIFYAWLFNLVTPLYVALTCIPLYWVNENDG